MVDIGNTEGVGGIGRIDGPMQPKPVSRPEQLKSSGPLDRVDISSQAQMMSDALSLPEIRADRVEEVRKLMESGRLLTNKRIEAALDRFLEENPDI